ncbi:conserved hypothetical protein [Ricinus communis]|uniref:Uncharacterized protein n=1 Tax=Ricinus communis TaxID=3988 RepID=B9T9F6_RICCO|nr:conserved hypothetical protein [Ricinus communis]
MPRLERSSSRLPVVRDNRADPVLTGNALVSLVTKHYAPPCDRRDRAQSSRSHRAQSRFVGSTVLQTCWADLVTHTLSAVNSTKSKFSASSQV